MISENISSNYGSMSQGFRRIARYLEKNFVELTFSSVAEFSKKCGVSEATVIRFAYKLGFSGYSDMQRQACFDLSNSSNISKGEDYADEEELTRISDLLMNSKCVLITGYLDSFGVAAELLHMLDNLRRNVQFSRYIQNWVELFTYMSPDTAAVFISIAPHYYYTVTMAKEAHDRGCRIISICDSPLNPISEYAELSVNIRLDRFDGTDIPLFDTRPMISYIYSIAKCIVGLYPEKIAEFKASGYLRDKYKLWEE